MKKMMPWMLTLIALAIGPAAYGDEGKVVHIDQRRILQVYQQSDPALAQLKEEVEQRQQEFEAQKSEIRAMRERFGAQQATLSEEERLKQQTELTGKATALIDSFTKAQQQMKAKEEFLASMLIERVLFAIQELGEEKGYRYILEGDQRTVLFADDSLDVTDAVLEKLAEKR